MIILDSSIESMIYGYYPEIVTKPNDAEENLKLLSNSYFIQRFIKPG